MNALASLATAALLGTERRPPDWAMPDGALGDLIGKIPREPVEKALLQTAGVLGTCHLAGWTPPIASSVIAAAPAEDAVPREVSPPLSQVLAGVLGDGPTRLQAEAFLKLASAGCLIPHGLLPKALDCGRRNTALRASLLPVIGRRGAWLAAQNDSWAFATSGEAGAELLDDQLWHEGSLDQRKVFLIRLRQHDAAKARELVSAALSSEGARERAVFIEALTTSLTLDDQELLETTLTDKSKETRQAAARLLSSLEDSRFMQRMTARLQPCLTTEKKFLRGTVASLEPPAAYDVEWKVDLIEEARPKGLGMGDRAWWLFQIVRAAPLTWWETHTGMKPADLLAWAQKSDWKDALLQGWAAAQALQRRVEWAEAFLDAQIPPASELNVLDLLETLPLPLREKHFLKHFTLGNSHSVVLDQFLGSIPFDAPPLSPDVARPLLQFLKRRINKGEAGQDWQLRASLVELACVMPPSLFDEFASGWEITTPEVQPFVEAIARLGVVLDQRKHLQSLNPAN